MVTNKKITEAVETFKEVCEAHYPSCTSCPLGFEVSQIGGDNCRLQHTRPKLFKTTNPHWKALE